MFVVQKLKNNQKIKKKYFVKKKVWKPVFLVSWYKEHEEQDKDFFFI